MVLPPGLDWVRLDEFLSSTPVVDSCRSASHLKPVVTLLVACDRLPRRLLRPARSVSRPKRPANRLAPGVVEIIQAMAANNVLRGAERIRGELLKLGISYGTTTTSSEGDSPP